MYSVNSKGSEDCVWFSATKTSVISLAYVVATVLYTILEYVSYVMITV
jgi:hypothetical protein